MITGIINTSHRADQFITRWRVWPISKDRVPLFDYRADDASPLTYRDKRGVCWRPNRSFDTDWGSVPLLLQGIVSPISAPCSFLMHDSGYEFHGLWRVDPTTNQDAFQPMSREAVDQLCLREMLAEETGSNYIACKAHFAVQVAGQGVWDDHPHTDGNAEKMGTIVRSVYQVAIEHENQVEEPTTETPARPPEQP